MRWKRSTSLRTFYYSIGVLAYRSKGSRKAVTSSWARFIRLRLRYLLISGRDKSRLTKSDTSCYCYVVLKRQRSHMSLIFGVPQDSLLLYITVAFISRDLSIKRYLTSVRGTPTTSIHIDKWSR
jgi:transposase